MSEKPGFIGQLLGVLYKPQVIFSTVDETDLTRGIFIAFLMVVLAAYSTMTYMYKIPLDVLAPQLLVVDTGPLAGGIGLISGIAAGFSLLVGWAITCIILHLLGMFLGVKGTLKRYFALYGFSTVPALLNQLLRVFDAIIMDSATLTGYFVSYRDISNKVFKGLIGANILNIWTFAGILLIMFSIEENYGVSRRRAVMISVVPSILAFALVYFTA